MSDEVDRVKVHLVVAGWYWATPGRDGYQGAETAADCARLDEEMLSDGSAGAVDALTWADEMTGASIYGYDRLAALEAIAEAARAFVDADRAYDAVGCAGDPQRTPEAEEAALWVEAEARERLALLFYPDDTQRIYTAGNLEEAP
jgi:hypothetical protein